MSGRKQLSGAEYRKQKAQWDRNLQPGSLNKYIKTSHKEGGSSKIGCLDGSSDKLPILSITHNTSSSLSDDGGNVSNEEHSEARVDNIAIFDPGSWPAKLTDSLRVSTVKQGPAKPDPMYEYPKDAFNHRFTVTNMKHILKNGEEVNCLWLVYLTIKNAVFCFCCKLFSSLGVALTKSSYNDWRNLYHTLKDHKTSKHHLHAHKKWIELSDRLHSNTTIDKRNQHLLDAETRKCLKT
jgi:hypothetical protein